MWDSKSLIGMWHLQLQQRMSQSEEQSAILSCGIIIQRLYIKRSIYTIKMTLLEIPQVNRSLYALSCALVTVEYILYMSGLLVMQPQSHLHYKYRE